MTELKNYIAGSFEESSSQFDKISPFDGSTVAKVHEASADQVDRAVKAGNQAVAGDWGKTSIAERVKMLSAISEQMQARADDFIAAEVADTGRSIFQSRMADTNAFGLFARYGALAESLRDETGKFQAFGTDGMYFTERRPRGVIACIAPWNMPLLLLSMKLAPALAMGNAAIAKPSEETPSSATVLAEVIDKVGLPSGVFALLHGFGEDSAGSFLTSHPGVAAFNFTGEASTGESIMRAASKGLREVNLELGGKNPAIVFADADLDAAAEGIARSAFFNCGQICFCTERIYAHQPVFDELLSKLKARAENIVIGQKDAPGFTIGPLISRQHREKVQSYMQIAKDDGGNFVCGGKAPEFGDSRDQGAFFQPTIVTGLPESSRFVREEIFGPVCHIAAFENEQQAVELANDTDYGLAACVWSQDASRTRRVAQQLNAGHIWINSWQLRDPMSPIAGHGRSGFGTAFGKASLEFSSIPTTTTLKV